MRLFVRARIKPTYMTKLTELASLIIALVAEETEITQEIIVSKSRTAEAVDARHLAELTGIAHNHISRIEQGRYNVNLDTLAVIADALGLKPAII